MPSGRRLSELPEAPYKILALDAQDRGQKLVGEYINRPIDLIVIGALDIIRELSERIDHLEQEKQ